MQYQMLVLATAFILALLSCHVVSGMPRAMQEALRDSQSLQVDRRGVNKCDVDQGTRDMCERCAKSTKVSLAYKLCCIDEDDSYSWCIDFLRPGIGRN